MNSLRILKSLPEQQLFTRGFRTTNLQNHVLKRFLSSNHQPMSFLNRLTPRNSPLLFHDSIRVLPQLSAQVSRNTRLHHDFNSPYRRNSLLSNPRIKTGVAVSVGVASLFLIPPIFTLILNGAVGYGVYRIFRRFLEIRFPSKNVNTPFNGHSPRRVKIHHIDK
ncbi:hypothetical protein K7432_007138 [Basidiobolus ranarum]|uniref:Transmembrane protein n=1 Tax=Basidiobolus ranarum TaxID=34480 RepID=A0ABR2W110_9FUNG